MTLPFQPGILPPIPTAARYVTFRMRAEADPRAALAALARRPLGDHTVIGIGRCVARALGREIEGLDELPALAGPGVTTPSTPRGLWCWLRGEDPGELLHRGRSLAAELAPAFVAEHAMNAFRYERGLDLSGYEDGTENPTGDEALAAAFVSGQGAGLDGGSFVAAQRWEHDLERLASYPPDERDRMIGRRREDNEELADAPASAHVKRTAQEDFGDVGVPDAFVLRRSMPFADDAGQGLVFVSFGRSFEAFSVQLARMVGEHDGVTDALFRFSTPESQAGFFCPPMRDGALDLRALGL